MKKESAVSLFFNMFLKAIVIILGLVIIIFGIVFLVKVVKHDSGEKAPATTVNENILTEAGKHDDLLYNTADDEDTEEGTTESSGGDDTTTDSFGYSIIVLNSTDHVGLAGRWAEKLTGYGYTVSEKADYFNSLTSTKIISTKEGVGKDLVQYFKSATYEVGQLTEGSNVSLSGYDIIVIIGEEDYDGQ